MPISKISKGKSDWHKLNFSVPITCAGMFNDEFIIDGTAINATVTRNGTEFIAEELDMAASSLGDKPVLKDHNNSVDSIVGRTFSGIPYDKTNNRLPFKAKIMDKGMQTKIEQGLVTSVSVGAMVRDLVENEKNGSLIAKGITFVELSLVAVPADPMAGFAKAICESFKLKKESENDTIQKETKEGDKMVDENLEKENAELKEKLAKIDEANKKIAAEKKFNEEVAKKVAEEKAKMVKAQEETKPEPEKKEDPPKDETKGEVTPEGEKKESNIILEKSEQGTGFDLSRSSYDGSEFSRLRRD